MSAALVFLSALPLACWWWRPEIVRLVSDCIAEGIRKSRKD